MASTDKTPKLGLNQWAAGDRVLRTDFNEDNGKIEAGIEGTKALVEANKAAIAAAHALAARKVGISFGQFIGDGTDNRRFSLGLHPLLIVLQSKFSGSNAISVLTPDCSTTVLHSGVNSVLQTIDKSMLYLTDDGFAMGLAAYYNGADTHIYYAAFY